MEAEVSETKRNETRLRAWAARATRKTQRLSAGFWAIVALIRGVLSLEGPQLTLSDGTVMRLRIRELRLQGRAGWKRRATRAISAAHMLVLAIGIIVVVVGVMIVLFGTGYFPYLTPFYLLIVGIVLIFLGLIETVVEGETKDGRGGRRSHD